MSNKYFNILIILSVIAVPNAYQNNCFLSDSSSNKNEGDYTYFSKLNGVNVVSCGTFKKEENSYDYLLKSSSFTTIKYVSKILKKDKSRSGYFIYKDFTNLLCDSTGLVKNNSPKFCSDSFEAEYKTEISLSNMDSLFVGVITNYCMYADNEFKLIVFSENENIVIKGFGQIEVIDIGDIVTPEDLMKLNFSEINSIIKIPHAGVPHFRQVLCESKFKISRGNIN